MLAEVTSILALLVLAAFKAIAETVGLRPIDGVG